MYKVCTLIIVTLNNAPIFQNGCTALHISAGNGNELITKMLMLDHHTDINAQDKHGLTPLHHAARNGHVKVVDALAKEENILINMPGLVRYN